VQRLALLVVVCFLVCAAGAGAHAPTTAIGRAVEALGSVAVSYEPGAAVTDIEAGNFPLLVGSNPKVAFMPASASTELAGGPNAIADEVAREAELDGTLIVLVGTNLGWWSNDIGDDRLAELVREARTDNAGASAAVVVASLVRGVQAESTSNTPWALLGLVLLVLGSGAFVAVHRISRRRSQSSP
jgi:hypothetical protein